MGSKHTNKKMRKQNENPQNSETQKRETLDVKIQTTYANSEKMAPLVGYFPSTFDPCKDSEPPEVSLYRDLKRKSRVQVVVNYSKGSHVDFVGTNYSGEAAAPQLCTYALGVLDKHTRTLSILPITANKIFRLEPKHAELDATEDEDHENFKDEVDAEEKTHKTRRLDSMYSTKKTITKNKKIDLLHQKQDPRSKHDLAKALEEVKVNAKALDAGTTNARNIPFYDMSASTPEKAYPLEKIIEEGEWDYLSNLLDISQGTEVTPDAYPIFVCNRVHKLENIKDRYEKRKVAVVLQYITHLIKYKDKHSTDHLKSVNNHKFPSILEAKLRSRFELGSGSLSEEKRSLLISHVLVLTLVVDGYRSDTSDIAKDLKMSAAELKAHYAKLGCKFVLEKSALLATLPVPLKFEDFRGRKKRHARV